MYLFRYEQRQIIKQCRTKLRIANNLPDVGSSDAVDVGMERDMDPTGMPIGVKKGVL